MCYGQNGMFMPHLSSILRLSRSSLCRKKAEACAVSNFIVAIFIGIIGLTGDSGERIQRREVLKKCF